MCDNAAPRAKGEPVEHLHNAICQTLLCKPLARKSPSGWRLIASVFHFVVTVQTPSLARRRSQVECARALPRACDVAAGLRCFGNFLDPRRAATPAGVVLVAKLSEAPTNSGWPPRLARLSGSIPFCLSILSYTLGFMSSNSSARRPIGRGFALFCLADGPNEIAGATR